MTQATTLSSRSTFNGAELPQAKRKRLVSMRAGSPRSCPTLCTPVDCGLPGFSVREGFSRQEYWSVLASTGCHILLKLYIFCYPKQPTPLRNGLPETLRPKQLHRRHTWPHRGRPESPRAASGANPSEQPTCSGGNKTTTETLGQCG